MTSNLPLGTLGSQIKAHIRAGDRAKEKAEQQYKAAGLYLIEARERVKADGKHWVGWLRENVTIAPSRAYEIIAIADGSKTLEQLREDRRQQVRRSRARTKAKAIVSDTYQTGSPRADAEMLRARLLSEAQDFIGRASIDQLHSIDQWLRASSTGFDAEAADQTNCPSDLCLSCL
jgi:hypothetical protein